METPAARAAAARAAASLCGTHEVLAGVEAVYELPRSPAAGIVLLLHGMCHGAVDWWPPGERCSRCVGLPEEQRIVRAVLNSGWAAVALSSKDRRTKRWRLDDDAPRVSAALAAFRAARGLPDVPVSAFGVSAGGSFVLGLPRAGVQLHAIVCQIMAVEPQALGLPSSHPYPPTLFQHMARDRRTATLVGSCVAALRAAGVRASQSEQGALRIGEGFFSARIGGIDAALSARLYSALLSDGLIDADGMLRDDPRRSNWRDSIESRPELSAALPGTAAGERDSLLPDASPLSEVMNVAFGVHEIFADQAVEAVGWMTDGGGYAVWACGCVPCYCVEAAACLNSDASLRGKLDDFGLGSAASRQLPHAKHGSDHGRHSWLCCDLRGLKELPSLHERLRMSPSLRTLGRRQRAVNLLLSVRDRLDEAAQRRRPPSPPPTRPAVGGYPSSEGEVPSSSAPQIPRRLFTFWDDSPMPELVRCCLGMMRQRNPSWELSLLRPSHAGLPPPPVPSASLSAAQLADWYRLAALAEHGGVYLDASCIPLGPIEAWVDVGSAAVQGFALVHDGDTMESWAIAAPRGSAFVANWRDEFGRALQEGVKVYCHKLERPLVTPGLQPSLPYLAIHAAWRVARARTPGAQVALRPANGPHGPYRHLATAGFDSEAAVASLFAAPAAELASTPLLKMRGAERNVTLPLAEYGRDSWLARELLGSTVPSTVKERLAFLRCGLELPE